ncbi:MAG: radical SAM family heme chaperone HemW [Pyramidobacter sp.]|nr:radical SAM family heme chaperone HemW [Pyramidobacter sp.]
MENKREFSLYVHVPFCRSKCPYCAFYSFSPRRGEMERWTACAVRELETLKRDHLSDGAQLATIYLGGGTPSYLPLEQWRALCAALDELPRTADCEFTVEANPDSVSVEKLALWKDHGVTRVSLGVQSLDDGELKRLARPHMGDEALRAVEACLSSGLRVSADLMFALPDQTLRNWHRSLSGIVRTGVTHVSVYQLTIEPDSFWGRHTPQGLPDGYAMYRWAQYYLPRKGLKQYEIASFAREGHESRHNLAYWRRKNVLAVGPGAWGFLDGRRFASRKDLAAWAEAVENGLSPVEYEERLSGAREAGEAAVLALRTAEGIDCEAFARRYGREYLDAIEKKVRDLPDGYFLRTERGFSLSPRGMRVGNAIWSELIGLEEGERSS